jgi:hypothetical protein
VAGTIGVRRQRQPTAALWLAAELSARVPLNISSYEESQSGGVAAALQIFPKMSRLPDREGRFPETAGMLFWAAFRINNKSGELIQ